MAPAARLAAVAVVLLIGLVAPVQAASPTLPEGVWDVATLKAALEADEAVLIDIRSREEWAETGVAEGAWPISMHEKGFSGRLFRARELAGERTVALICATGGRTGSIFRVMRSRGIDEGFVDVSEGMMGSRLGKGWIRSGLPLTSLEEAMATLPEELDAGR